MGPGTRASARRWRIRAGWIWLVLALACAQARATQAPPAVVLDPAQAEVLLDGAPGWFGDTPREGIASIVAAGPSFAPLAGQVLPFREGKALWLKLRLRPVADAPEVWYLEVPVPVLDHVSLHRPDASGGWRTQQAGDLVPMRAWPHPGRYPFFRLELPPGTDSELYLEIRHANAIAVPVRLATASFHQQRMQLEYLGLGLAMGALALLAFGTLLRGLALRDAAYAWYAAYALVALLALAAFTGLAAHLAWGDAGPWVDRAAGCLAILAAALMMVVVGHLSRVVSRVRWLGRMLQGLACAGPLLALAYLLPDKRSGVMLLGWYLLAVAGANLCAAAVTIRRGDRAGLWMLAGALPLTACVVLTLARLSGWLPASVATEYALVLALTVNLPVLLAALNSRSFERRGLELRRLAAEHQDALTGLVKHDPFVARLRLAVGRYTRRGEDAAVAVIELANLEWIQKVRGAEAGEEALLRSVIKLRRLVRDVDTIGRLSESRFGLILEGAAMRKPMANLGARMVAAGLMEEPGRPGDVPLHFHMAAVVLHERPGKPEELLQALGEMLDSMRPRTQRPVRFVEASQPSTTSDALEAPEAVSAST